MCVTSTVRRVAVVPVPSVYVKVVVRIVEDGGWVDLESVVDPGLAVTVSVPLETGERVDNVVLADATEPVLPLTARQIR